MEDDELEIDKISDRKTVLFCVVSDTDKTFTFISARVYNQMFNSLCDKALENDDTLKTHITCLLDKFSNQKIPNFEHLAESIISNCFWEERNAPCSKKFREPWRKKSLTCITLLTSGEANATWHELSEIGKEVVALDVKEFNCLKNEQGHDITGLSTKACKVT